MIIIPAKSCLYYIMQILKTCLLREYNSSPHWWMGIFYCNFKNKTCHVIFLLFVL